MLKRHSQYFEELIFDRTGEIGTEILDSRCKESR
jgi:hypothetical protein